tara:strand:+ start:77 stop:250 length:174 start_codon:yes stop_codon:yes gene_type:complete
MTHEQKLEHMCTLKKEVEVLKTMIRPHDTGHIYTTISTLEDRIKTIYKEIYSSKARM